jgi:hypothetical protein
MSVERIGFDMGFAPDVDPSLPGALTDCFNFVPSARGMRALTQPILRDVTTAPTFTSDTIVGFGFERYPSNASALSYDFAGTRYDLYSRDWFSTAWTDASRTAGYATTAAECWTFERFGDFMLAAATPLAGGSIPLQQCTLGSAQFTDIPGAPTCAVICAAERFVLAFNGRAGNDEDWSCSARDSHTSWTVNPSTLATSGFLVDPPGPITAATAFGNDVIAFKARAMILGRFVPGSTEVWEWRRLPYVAGARGPRAVCSIDDGRIAFMGPDSCYIYDGARVVDVLDVRARSWYARYAGINSIAKQSCVYDAQSNSVWFCYSALSKTGLGALPYSEALVLNLTTNRLGLVQIDADIIAEMVDPNTLAGAVPGYFDAVSHRQWAFSRYQHDTVVTPAIDGFLDLARPYVITGDRGDPYDFVQARSLRLDMPTKGSGVMTAELRSRDTRVVSSERTVVGSAIDATYERFDARGNGHWHRIKVGAEAGCELAGVWIEGDIPSGRRK